MASIIPNDGAGYILTAVKTAATDGLYLALLTALPADDATLASGLGEVVAATGSYSRAHCTNGNLVVAGDTMTLTGTFEFTGFTHVAPVTHMALCTTSDSAGKLVAATSLATGNRTLANVADKLTITNPTFRLI